MNRQSAFLTPGRKMLKGGLHCHTARSDGQGTPEEVIARHEEMGYDFLALTDHRIYNLKNFLPNSKLTIIPGMEIDADFPDEDRHCYHIVCLGPISGNGFSQDERVDSRRVTCAKDMQPTLDAVHAKNNMTIYCHPEWSGTSAREFEDLQGNFAMEIWNSGCAIENDMDTNAAYWDELLIQGKRLFGVAVDDGHPMYQHGNGYVYVNAENDVDSILSALKNGAFYSSCGPEIYDFGVENGEAYIKCSPAKHIYFKNFRLPAQKTGDGTAPITEARTYLYDALTYIRAVVVDDQGRRAWTNPIFLK